MKLKIAIVGLGRVGTLFLDQMLESKSTGIEIVAVAELSDTPGKKKAIENNLPVKGIEDIVTMNEGVDILFDLTGHEGTRKELRELMVSKDNKHTVIAPETIAYLIWGMTTRQALPDVHTNKGY